MPASPSLLTTAKSDLGHNGGAVCIDICVVVATDDYDNNGDDDFLDASNYDGNVSVDSVRVADSSAILVKCGANEHRAHANEIIGVVDVIVTINSIEHGDNVFDTEWRCCCCGWIGECECIPAGSRGWRCRWRRIAACACRGAACLLPRSASRSAQRQAGRRNASNDGVALAGSIVRVQERGVDRVDACAVVGIQRRADDVGVSTVRPVAGI